MSSPVIVLMNQYGEQSINYVLAGSTEALPVATHTIMSNLTSGTALPIANTYAAVAAVLPCAMLLTGYASSAGSVAAGDTLLVGINKLNGNQVLSKATADAALPSASFTAAAVTSKLLTGLASGANSVILATDTILEALAKLQAQISA